MTPCDLSGHPVVVVGGGGSDNLHGVSEAGLLVERVDLSYVTMYL